MNKKIFPKKSLGQNFLRDKNILEKIVEVANLKADDFVIEVGPGEGVLTEELTKKAGRVVTVEIDNNLAASLDSRFRGNDKVRIVNDDILKINLPKLIEENNFQNYKVVANIPYYITSPIIQLFLETKYPPREMIFMVQREVAERIVAKPGNMSILAISVQYYAHPELLFQVSRKSFWPVPEVDSAVIRIETGSQNKEASNEETKKFFQVVKAGFSAKRKTLLNNLSSSLHLDRKVTEKAIKKAGIRPTQRAQELSVEDWKKLATLIYEKTSE